VTESASTSIKSRFRASTDKISSAESAEIRRRKSLASAVTFVALRPYTEVTLARRQEDKAAHGLMVGTVIALPILVWILSLETVGTSVTVVSLLVLVCSFAISGLRWRENRMIRAIFDASMIGLRRDWIALGLRDQLFEDRLWNAFCNSQKTSYLKTWDMHSDKQVVVNDEYLSILVYVSLATEILQESDQCVSNRDLIMELIELKIDLESAIERSIGKGSYLSPRQFKVMMPIDEA
jgi:hypothetical protein